MKRALKLKASEAGQLQLQAARKTEELKAHGVDRVLIVYEKAASNSQTTTCSVYQEQTQPKN